MQRAPARTRAPLPMPRFADRLQDGERLLWEGRPDVRVFLRSERVKAARFILPLIPLILLLEYGICWGFMPWSSPITWACPVVVWLICYLVFTAQAPAQAQAAAYALTNKRLFIRRMESLTSQDWRPCIDEIPLQSVQPGLRPQSGSFGTITLGAAWMAVYNTQRELRAIPDAAAVFALFIEAQAAVLEAMPAEPAGPYYASLKPAGPPAAWTLEDTLRHGETVLWQGGVNAQADLREGWWAIPFLAVVMAVLGGWILSWLGNWSWLWQVLIFAGSLAIVLPISRSGSLTVSGHPRYVLTNRRVLIVKNVGKPGQKIEERELPETRAMRLKPGRDGIGTIIFEKKTRFVWHGQSGTVETYEFSFKHIADAEAVYGLIQAAQSGSGAAARPGD